MPAPVRPTSASAVRSPLGLGTFGRRTTEGEGVALGEHPLNPK
jgi:hypothetical protein